ncbi:MAG TPA: hypothetical protein VMX17_05675 [Candidatus Glassbacteria bacterium]|nr:hypothetical protein [Candidatus Glassbacteria bacterium]
MGRIPKLMKYLEELIPGECFTFEKNHYIKLGDYKKSGERCCVSLNTGTTRWLQENIMVDLEPIYSLDRENNVIAIRNTEKNNVST